MAGLKGKRGPPGNTNAFFRHGLAAIQKCRRKWSLLNRRKNVRQQILEI